MMAIKGSPHQFDYTALLQRGRSYRHLGQREKAKQDLELVQRSGYQYDLQILNELKLLELGNQDSDEMVIDEEEEKAKAGKARAALKEQQEMKEEQQREQ